MSKNNSNGRILVIFSDEKKPDYSYERLCDYYRAKQKEIDMIHIKAKHEVGSKREKVKFAFFPVIIESRLKWLVKYKSIQKYVKEVIWDDFDYCYNNEYYWLEVERKLFRR